MHSRSSRRHRAGEGTGIGPKQTQLYCDSYFLLGTEAAFLRASGQSALTWQIARQLVSATGGTNSSVAEASSLLSMLLYRPSQVNFLLLPAPTVGYEASSSFAPATAEMAPKSEKHPSELHSPDHL